MSTGQTLLALGAIVLLSIISLNIGQMHVQAVEATVDTQESADGLNFGRDMVEELQSYAYNYGQLEAHFGGMNDVTDPDKRREYVSQIGKSYYVTVDLSNEKKILHDQFGRTATVKVYEDAETGGGYQLMAEYRTAILPL